MNSLPDRRRFLFQAASSSLALAGWSCASRKAERTDARTRQWIVVGAGLGGLVAAREILRRGEDVLLLEASSRLGGRVLTERDGFTPGLRAEAGAERVAPGDSAVHALLTEYGIETVSYPYYPAGYVIHFEGQDHWVRGENTDGFEPADLPPEMFEGLSEYEVAAAPIDLHLAYARDHEPPAPDDPQSGLEWLRTLGLSRRAEEMLLAFCTLPVRTMSAHSFSVLCRRELASFDSLTLAGGSDLLIDSLAAEVESRGGRMRFGARVAAVSHTGDDRIAVCTDTGTVLHADALILALPGPVLGKLQLEHALGREIARRLGGLGFGHERKGYFEVDVADLRSGREPAYAYRDSVPRVRWVLPEIAEGRSIANVMAFGPEEARQIAHLRGRDFASDPYFGCTFAYPLAGSVMDTSLLQHGRIAVAGSDLSARSGWMEGAVLASQRAVAALSEVLGPAAEA